MTILGRAGLDHPTLGQVPKETVYEAIETIYENISNDLSGRYYAVGPVSDGSTAILDHGFGVALTELNVKIYTGSAPNLTRVTTGFSFAATVGSEKTSLTVTAPGSGGPHTFVVWIVHGHDAENVSDLNDVTLASAAHGDFFVYDSGTSKWVNKPFELPSETATIASNRIIPTSTRPTKRITGTASELHMLGSPVSDRVVILINETGSEFDIKHDTGATAAERFYTGTGSNLTLKNNAAVIAIYDAALLRWILIGGSGGSGGLSPESVTASQTAVTNKMYLANTSGGAFTLTLPSGTTEAVVGFLDALETFGTNKLTVAPASGQSIATGTADETLELDFNKANAVLFRAAGQTTWRIQYQATTIGGGSGSGGLTPVAISSNTTGLSNIMYHIDVSAATVTLTLPSGTSAMTVGFLDALENASETKFIRITPGSGDSIDGLSSADSLKFDFPRANAIFSKAAGSTSWKVQYQATTVFVPEAGRYTPTLYNITNVSASSANSLHYSRVGNIVTVGGYISVGPTAGANTSTEIQLSLPIASSLTSDTDVGGSGTFAVSSGQYNAALIYGNSALDRARIFFTSSSTGSNSLHFTFSYEVK